MRRTPSPPRSASWPPRWPRQAERLAEASASAADREAAHQAEEARLAALVRAAADRREGLARLTGQVNSLRSRAEAAEAEIGRLTLASEQAVERAEQAARAFTALETKVAGLDAGELGLDAEHEAAVEALDAHRGPAGSAPAARSWRRPRSAPAWPLGWRRCTSG